MKLLRMLYEQKPREIVLYRADFGRKGLRKFRGEPLTYEEDFEEAINDVRGEFGVEGEEVADGVWAGWGLDSSKSGNVCIISANGRLPFNDRVFKDTKRKVRAEIRQKEEEEEFASIVGDS